MIIVDTNVISELMRPAPERYVLAWIGEQDVEELQVAAITLVEIAYGVERFPGGRRKAMIRSTAHEAITAFRGRGIPFDEAAVPHYARIVSEGEHSGRPMNAFDGQIAAICAALDAPPGDSQHQGPRRNGHHGDQSVEHRLSDAGRLVDKLWSSCNVLRDDGVSTIEYTEQLTYLLFLKMAQERETGRSSPSGSCRPSALGSGCWTTTAMSWR